MNDEPWMSIEGDGSGHLLPEFNAEIESIDDPCADVWALADDLAAVLSATTGAWDPEWFAKRDAVLARYREARGADDQP